jgi:hypothetical protein
MRPAWPYAGVPLIEAVTAEPSSDLFDLSQFSLGNMTQCGIELRRLGANARAMEEVADRVVRYLYEHLRTPEMDARACPLVRMFVTLPFQALDDEQKAFAEGVLNGGSLSARTKCLTLLATAGDEPAWNSRHTSAGHKALPLPSAESIARAPMIAQLIRQLGVEIGTLLSADPRVMIDTNQHTFNVFYVADAPGSPHIPAQREFVEPYAIRSVLGFGGLLPSGDLFTTILFSKTHIPRNVADLFKTLALNVKVAILPFAAGPVFT